MEAVVVMVEVICDLLGGGVAKSGEGRSGNALVPHGLENTSPG